jgi:hypothetical protein
MFSKRMLLAGLGSVLIYAAVTWSAWQISERNLVSFAYSVAVVAVGTVCGWLIGALGSPLSEAERTKFPSFWQGIATFVSGYLFSKLEPALDFTSFVSAINTNPIHGVRIIFFITSVLLGTIDIYVLRAYGAPSLDTRKKEAP